MKTLTSTSRETVPSLQAVAPAAADPAFIPFVAASSEEVLYAQRLRERIEKLYLNQPAPRVTFWSVGAD
jgi:hypothetical protein